MRGSANATQSRLARPLAAGASYCIALFLVGCNSNQVDRPTDECVRVFAGIPPLAYLVEQIGGPHVTVDALIRPGQDPHTFEPTPQQTLALSRAAIFFKIDMPFERILLDKIQEGNRRLKVVDTTRGVKKRMLDAACCETAHSHEHEHEDQAAEPDPHVWLSPPLLKIQAENVAEALCQIDPAHAAEYRKNLVGLLTRINALHQRTTRMLAPYRGCSFYVFHPGFGYFADAYGLKQEAVEVGGQAPTPKQLRALIEKARADGVTTIFVQRQYAPQSAQVVAQAIGGKVVVIDGLAKNVIADIQDIAEKVETAMKESSPQRTQRTQRKDGVADGKISMSGQYIQDITFKKTKSLRPPRPLR